MSRADTNRPAAPAEESPATDAPANGSPDSGERRERSHNGKRGRNRARYETPRTAANRQHSGKPFAPWSATAFFEGKAAAATVTSLWRQISPTALGITIALHLLLLLPLASVVLREDSALADKAQQTPQVEFVPPPFVQVNPFANQEHINTDQEGAQNQRAAQEADPDPRSREEGPQLEGEDPKFNRIISGRPDAPDVAPSPAPAWEAPDMPVGSGPGSTARQATTGSKAPLSVQTRRETQQAEAAAANASPTAAPSPATTPSPAATTAAATAPAPDAPAATAAQTQPTTEAQTQPTTAAQPTPPAQIMPPAQATATAATQNQQPSALPADAAATRAVAPQTPEPAQVALPRVLEGQSRPSAEGLPTAQTAQLDSPQLPDAPEAAQPPSARLITATAEQQPVAPLPVAAAQQQPPVPQPAEPQQQEQQPAAAQQQPLPTPAATPAQPSQTAVAEAGETQPEQPATDPGAPRPRPTLEPRISSGPLRQQAAAASRRGVVAIDSKFSEFGAYQQRMVEAISAQWYLLARQSRAIDSEYGTQVVLRFKMNDSGIISNTEVRFTNASAAATLLCINAVESRSPFGLWNSDMKRVLGTEQTITFTFYYR